MRNNRGFTLVEIVVSTVVLSLIIVGMLSIFVAGSKHLIHTRERMTSMELGKFFLDPMQMDVRQDTWDDLGNDLTPVISPVTEQIINNREFSETHTVDANVAGTDLRRVTTTITWNEPSAP